MPQLRYTKRGRQSGFCKTCNHPERGRIDWLIACGGTRRAIADKFGLPRDGLLRHAKNHISPEYIKTVKIGPFGSEAALRKLVSENSVSVVENLTSIYGALASRFLANLEAGADAMTVQLAKSMHDNLALRARISKELQTAPSMVVNVLNQPVILELQSRLLEVLTAHPAARAAVLRAFRDVERQPPQLVEIPGDAGQAA
jgi:hypothetical protein